MAGGHGPEMIKLDPAIERWNVMREDVFKHFRFTSRTTRVVLLGLGAIPVGMFYMFSAQDKKWNWNGKLKGESLAARPPQPEPEA